MNINNIKLSAWTFLVLLIGASACTDGFEELNTNPNDPVSVPADVIFPYGIQFLKAIRTSTGSYKQD